MSLNLAAHAWMSDSSMTAVNHLPNHRARHRASGAAGPTEWGAWDTRSLLSSLPWGLLGEGQLCGCPIRRSVGTAAPELFPPTLRQEELLWRPWAN